MCSWNPPGIAKWYIPLSELTGPQPDFNKRKYPKTRCSSAMSKAMEKEKKKNNFTKVYLDKIMYPSFQMDGKTGPYSRTQPPKKQTLLGSTGNPDPASQLLGYPIVPSKSFSALSWLCCEADTGHLNGLKQLSIILILSCSSSENPLMQGHSTSSS